MTAIDSSLGGLGLGVESTLVLWSGSSLSCYVSAYNSTSKEPIREELCQGFDWWQTLSHFGILLMMFSYSLLLL